MLVIAVPIKINGAINEGMSAQGPIGYLEPIMKAGISIIR